jgi:hypothetical protein
MKDLWQPKSFDITFSRHGAIRTVFSGLQKGGHDFSELAFPGKTPQNRLASRDPSSKKDKGDLVPRIVDVQQNLTSIRNGRLGREAQNRWRVRDSGTGSRLVTVLEAVSSKNASGSCPTLASCNKM